MNRDDLLNAIRTRMPEKRYVHTLGVMETAIGLAKVYGESEKAAELAAILHDVVKFADRDWMKQTMIEQQMEPTLLTFHHELWHAPVGAFLAQQEFGVTNQDVLNAICYHTTGRKYMSKLEKIIYCADMIEPNRKFSGVDELRQQADQGLELLMKACVKHSIQFLIKKNQPVYPDSIHCYNDLVTRKEND
ncbi:bis(5'-nucleosyl)-tetraphosphatase (symmetrical) YqeK [Paenisporosarcina antarctica]|uniref:bis(5'-nucleosyl)-tetraphosphatase (symmetrical) n=1 Tax=Paenisporosarcina antarctica TaxID=417367 RepID=A0A4P6ZX59_9BACL|nr:bis(5'-nucleosyl)-tetraphosphatase (symmetrical) YqeK [Paenisporosarcina antarctica]QBP40844.1 HD domain-containing protein [Paenisporosarcina antarctica]